MDKPAFVYVIYIATTAEQVWQALTDGDFTYHYWGGRRIESDWQVGSPVRHIQENGELDWHGEILEADPPRRLSYTFDVNPASDCKLDHSSNAVDEIAPEPSSRVSFDIETFMDEVKLTVTHDQFEPGSRIYKGISNGWPAILSGLKSLLEVGKPLFPDWR